MTLMQRPGTHVAMLAAVGIRFAAALAAAGIMLSGCSVADGILGGSDKDGAGMTMTPAPAPAPTPTPTPTPTPAPAPGPSADARSKFFPVPERAGMTDPTATVVGGQTGARVASGGTSRIWGLGTQDSIVGKSFETLVGEEWNSPPSRTFPQFSEFEFGSPADSNGIPLQTAPAETASAENPRSVAAYQAVLEHSMFLFQGGLYRYAIDGVHAARPGMLALSTGDPTSGPAIAGSWTGKAVGFETDGTRATDPYFPLHPTTAERLIVQGDVEIGVTLDSGTQNVRWAFRNWDGGSIDYPTVDHTGANFVPSASDDHYLAYFGTGGNPNAWTSKSVGIQFYGPGRQEAGGLFEFVWQDRFNLTGVYGAKKQP